MGKATRMLLLLGGALLVVVAAAVWLLVSNLDSIVKRVVEDVGSETLGTKVSLSRAAVSLQDASAALRGLKIRNPRGFAEPYAFELGEIEVTIDPKSATTDEIVLPKIVVDQAQLTFEQDGVNNNLQTLLNNIDSAPASEPAGEAEGEASELRFVIQEFRLQGASVTLRVSQLAQPLSFTMTDIVLRDVGRKGAGVTAEEVARQLIEPVLDRTMKAATARATDEIEALARKQLGEQTGKALDSVKKKLFGR